jgi:hypothetical protein
MSGWLVRVEQIAMLVRRRAKDAESPIVVPMPWR